MKIHLSLLALPLAVAASPQSLVFFDDFQAYSSVTSRIGSYASSISKEPLWTSWTAAIATAIPSSLDLVYIQTANIEAEEWYKSLPANVKSFERSVVSALIAIATSEAVVTPTGTKSGFIGIDNSSAAPTTTTPKSSTTTTASSAAASTTATESDNAASGSLGLLQGAAAGLVAALGAVALL